MSADTTTYYVSTIYQVHDRSSRQFEQMERAADRTGKSLGLVDRGYGTLAATLSGGLAMVAAKRSLIDFNAELEQSRIQIGGLLQLNMGGEWADSMGKATTLVRQLQEEAKRSVGTTKEMVEMASMLARPITAAGLGMEELRVISARATVAAKAFGVEAGVAALDIEQALAGTLTKQERFARALLEPMGFTTASFNKLDAKQRAQTLNTAFQQPALASMAKAQEQSYSGVVSTLQDNLEMALGKVGLPLFQRITTEVQRWNSWIEANTDRIESFSREMSSTLIAGFGVLKETAAWFIDNSTLLMTLAKALLAAKVGSALGAGLSRVSTFMGALAQGGNSFHALVGTTTQASSGLATMTSGIAKFVPWLSVGVTVIEGLVSWWNGQRAAQAREREKERREIVFATEKPGMLLERLMRRNELLDKKRQAGRGLGSPLALGEQAELQRLTGGLAQTQKQLEAFDRDLLTLAQKHSLITDNLTLVPQWTTKIQSLADELGIDRSKKEFIDFFRAIESLAKRRGQKGLYELLAGDQLADGANAADMAKAFEEALSRAQSLSGMAKQGTKVTINKVEVPARDPDRFIHDVAKAAERFNRNPTQARAALRGGL